MNKYTLSFKEILIFIGAIGGLVAFQFGVFLSIGAWTEEFKGQCKFASYSTNSDGIYLKLDCDGKKAWTSDSAIVLSYVKNPRPLNCSVWGSGKATCDD